ncbi:MAG TPA: hypothetical protein VIL43_13840 [Burkholderiales bacterium]
MNQADLEFRPLTQREIDAYMRQAQDLRAQTLRRYAKAAGAWLVEGLRALFGRGRQTRASSGVA